MIVDALKAGKLDKEEVFKSVSPLFYTRMRLGEFDPPEHNPYNFLDLSVIQSEEHRAISLTAAMKSFVLLKNKGGFLPITGAYNKISVSAQRFICFYKIYGHLNKMSDKTSQALFRLNATHLRNDYINSLWNKLNHKILATG